MSEKNPTIDLLDYALGIDGGDPVEVAVGPEVTLRLRQSHTGAQVAAFQKVEQTRANKLSVILNNDDDDAAAKARKLSAMMKTYIRDLIATLSVEDTPEADIKKAADLIAGLESDGRTATLRAVGTISGVVDADGNPTRSSSLKAGSPS